MEEQEAWKRLRDRDEAALGWFIDRYAAWVGTIISNIVGASLSVSDVEEVSSDVFFTLWVNADRVAPGKVKAYLGGVARNKAREAARRIGTEVPLEEDLILISEETPEREVEAREQARLIREAVLAMHQPEREIFLRYYYYCQPVAEIAEELGLNASTVKTKLHRGRKTLRETLKKEGYPIEMESV